MKTHTLVALAAASLLGGCASAPAVREAVNPADRAQRTITNFTPALRCMDDLLFQAGVRDLTVVMDDMRDATQRVPVGARDMMTSAVSEMTRRSRAVRLSLIGGGGEGGNLLQSLQQAKEANVFSVLPEYTLRGGVSQMDEDVQRSNTGVGLTAQLLGGLRVGNDSRFSVMGFDAAMLRTESLTLVPGVTSKNTTVLRRQETGATDGQATLRSTNAVFSFATTRSEGSAQAARNMVELAAIELVGKLTRLPYWQCLGTRDDDAEVLRETEDWFSAMDRDERIAFVKERLRERRWFDGSIDGQDDAAFQTSVKAYRAALGLAPNGALDLAFFRRFISVAVPAGPLAAAPRVARAAAGGAAALGAASGAAPLAAAPLGGAQLGGALLGGAPAGLSPLGPGAVAALQGAPGSPALKTPVGLQAATAALQKPTPAAPAAPAAGGPAGPTAPLSLRPIATAQGLALVLHAQQTGYIYCYAQDPATQAIRRIYPNRFDRDPRVVAGTALALPGKGKFVLQPDHQHACLFAEREVYGDLPGVLRWGDFQDLRLRSFEEVQQRFVESTGTAIALVRAPQQQQQQQQQQVARAGR